MLIPEVVLRGNLEIGRFEVTRAQYAESDKSYKFEPGTENYPASGVTFDQAKAYAAWLSKTTGQTWRLPNQKPKSPRCTRRKTAKTRSIIGPGIR